MLRFRILATALLTLSAASAGALELTADRDVYGSDDRIEVLAYNDADQKVMFGSSAPFVAYNLDTKQAYYFVGLAIVIDLAPGTSTDFGLLTERLAPGRYELVFTYYTPPYEPNLKSVFFTVVDARTPTEGGSVGALKSSWSRD